MPLPNFIVPVGIVLRTAATHATRPGRRNAYRMRRRGGLRLAQRLPAVPLVLLAMLLAGCGMPHPEPSQAHLITSSLKEDGTAAAETCETGWTRDIVRTSPARRNAADHPLTGAAPMHSPGDVVRLDIVDGADFAGVYTVNLDGHINLPYAGRIPAAGQSTAGLMRSIKQRLVQKKLFRAENLDISVIPIDWARIQISVSGAVFQPGRALTFATKDKEQDAPTSAGDSPPGRFLSSGMLLAGGVRPDADLSQVILSRSGRQFVVDLSGVINGAPVPEISLMNGDHIEVMSTGCRQSPLARPSQITPSVIRIFFSNMSIAPSTNSDQRMVQVPYGAKLIDGAMVANCVGGTQLTNASRRIAYISTEGGRSVVRDVRIRDMLGNPDDLAVNPHLMPNDAIACFDSEVTNIRDIARTLTELLNAYGLIITLL
jgi:polysaccharide export outer membrane protein